MLDESQAAEPKIQPAMNTKNTNDPVVPQVSWKVLESAGALALVTAIAYFMGHSYYTGYFRRLSFPSPYPELTTSDYVIRAFTSFASFFFLAMWVDNLANRYVIPRSYPEAFRVNAPFILVPIILGQYAYIFEYVNKSVAIWLGVVLIIGVFGIVTKTSIVGMLAREGSGYGFGALIAYAATLIYGFSLYFMAMGEGDAVRLIEGRSHDAVNAIVLTVRGDSPVNGVPLRVALDKAGRYYLVKPETEAPEAPTLYVVPESEILSAYLRNSTAAMATPVQ